MHIKIGESISLRHFVFPKGNQWRRRIAAVFAFILFDYAATLVFCHASYEEANLYARAFMEIFGILPGLTLFVLIINLPIYVVLSLDSHIIKLPHKLNVLAETFVDAVFAWNIAGLHFSGGTSWFWYAPDLIRQGLGTVAYLVMVALFVRPHKFLGDNSKLVCA